MVWSRSGGVDAQPANIRGGEGKCEVRGDIGDILGAVVACFAIFWGPEDDGKAGGLGDLL